MSRSHHRHRRATTSPGHAKLRGLLQPSPDPPRAAQRCTLGQADRAPRGHPIGPWSWWAAPPICSNLVFGRDNENGNAADVRVHSVSVDNDLRGKHVAARLQLAAEIDVKAHVLAKRYLARQHDTPRAVRHHILALRRRPFEDISRDRLQRPSHDVVAALVLHYQFDIAEESDLLIFLLDVGDVPATRNGIGVIGADAERIAEIAKCLERDAVGGPALEPVWTVGD